MSSAPPFLQLVRPSETETTTPDAQPIEAPPVTIDPGQVIRVNARFPGEPQRVLFSFLPPKSENATHDPGFGVEGSLLEREGDDLYFYSVDTRGMHGGEGWWYFVSEDDDTKKRRAKVGKFTVRDVPRALLERHAAPVPTAAPTQAHEDDGFDILGAVSEDDDGLSPTHVVVGLAVAIGISALL